MATTLQETENGRNKDLNGCTNVPVRRPPCSSFSHQIRIEATDGAYLAYTRRRTREPQTGKGGKYGQGRKRRSGEEKAVRGGETPRGGNNPKKMPARAARHPPCVIPTGRWPESRRPEPGEGGWRPARTHVVPRMSLPSSQDEPDSGIPNCTGPCGIPPPPP